MSISHRTQLAALSSAIADHLNARTGRERTNADRARKGEFLCLLMHIMTGVDDVADAAGDAICQILHYGMREGLDVQGLFDTAKMNLEAELEEEPAGSIRLLRVPGVSFP